MSSSPENIIGKGTWIDKIAYTIVEREKKLGRSTANLNVESGLGASGIPHIGSMGDAVRAYGISLALQNLGYSSELIAFSDDLDGLRKVPAGLPEWLEDHICKPVSSIPDPFGDCHDSYGQHMSSLLLEGLNSAGIKYTFKSGTQTYKSGILADQIHKILSNSKLIGDKIAESTGQQKYLKFLPYFPICENCNRLYVANSIEYLENDRAVTYSCTGNTIGKKLIQGCGHTGRVKIDSGNGKLAWKVEFAARWQAFDIKFEAFGKDIMDSVKMNDWISDEILKFNHPLHAKYEMFLDKGGKKISKSAGNVLTPQMWLKYGTPESLLLLLYKRISGTRHVSIDDIPTLMDEYDLFEDIFFGKVKEPNDSKRLKINGVYEYINHLRPPVDDSSSIHIPYRILIQQANLFKYQIQESDLLLNTIFDRLKKYRLVKEEDIKKKDLIDKITLAVNWVGDFSGLTEDDDVDGSRSGEKLEMSSIQKEAILRIGNDLTNLISNINKKNKDIKSQDNDLAQEVQTIIFNNAKNNNLQPKEIFRILYKILINAEKGPRLGNYIVDLGIDNVVKVIEKRT
ncbi:lysine--tRNA ligase [Candidatus Nitrosocosmicus arcticus]|uniref:Lysine--tRNA ligase n=1 Tax=Candidatus Nitrosocosmicus arcticus TaxID=2035267 RepID=A0A557SYH6_9ARCH|nr:lysine--tRNA ligase [Candidatus Nitrosocosmicus arcticus]TVP41656.1 Lysine-tRNA ligase [Candidatus Nitrosocosmicus arcticus]